MLQYGDNLHHLSSKCVCFLSLCFQSSLATITFNRKYQAYSIQKRKTKKEIEITKKGEKTHTRQLIGGRIIHYIGTFLWYFLGPFLSHEET
jgi:hypothetical protein